MIGRQVILVRHAMPDIRRGVAPALWGLSEASREDCVLLAHALPDGLSPTIFASDEPKARETAEIIGLRRGLQVALDTGFREVDRPTAWDDDYRIAAASYLANGLRDGWEPRDSVVRRFGRSVLAALNATEHGTTVIVNHGLALSLWLAALADIDLVPFWQALTLPDAWLFDIDRATSKRLWTG